MSLDPDPPLLREGEGREQREGEKRTLGHQKIKRPAAVRTIERRKGYFAYV